ncbi:angiomotin-like protein 2 isoform X2 [Cylas formicarius]|uniref:angiomotin-like protein 2 isoform X2 n=1 Tax=Cylas formicarius TaxID=197179 RepID=UPI00295840A9|nr:angiomotin-like protein 2 isoform X2 [Cylas formicarius]
MQQSNRYRAYSIQMGTGQGNFPQSLSGSETDVSTSNENLSNEEKYVIRHTPRQEPQGQENLQSSNRSSLRDSLPSNRSSLDVSSSSYNTLIIHSAGDEPWTGRNSSPREITSSSSNYIPQQSSLYNDPKSSPIQKRSSATPSPSITGVQEITEIPDDYLSQSSVLKHLAKEVKVPSPSGTSKDDTIESLLRKFDPTTFDINNLPPPPEYPHKWSEKSPLEACVNNRNKINSEKLALSKSQPDLTSVGVAKGDFTGFRRGVSAPRPPTKGREENESNAEEVWPSSEMIEILIKENSALKHELENCYQRVEKTHKLEQEILKVHKAHEELGQSCDRRERLERAARARLQADCRRYQDLNRALREQVDLLSTQVLSRSPGPDGNGPDSLRRELSKREGIIKQLIMQNKELAAAKERQEIELAAQRATLQEQRTHIDILDTALTNAQGNVVRLEEECRKKQVYVERVAQLQRALYSLQMASDRREETERKLRLQLERELQRTKAAQGNERKGGWDSPNGSGESTSELKRQLREKDESIMKLEGECAKWEQRFLEENALRQAAIEAASIPKDAKIAALEKTSQETEKIIAEARNEKIRHMDEVHAAQKKVADLESRLKDLESKLAEKDAMIKVLQKHTYDKDVSMLGRSPHHTPHPSLGGTDLNLGLGATVSREELVSSVLTNSTAYGSSNSYTGSDSSFHMPSYSKYENKNFDTTKQTLDSQLKEIDSQLDTQLLSKRGLCCFPGLPNPIAAQRKGKVPKPLLAGIKTSNDRPTTFEGNSTFFTSTSRHENGDMLFLEKQGLTSQQQRMTETNITNNTIQEATTNICPSPSSLPRPPRSSHRSGLPRRMGDYNRLDNSEPQRKNSNGGDSLSSNTSSRRASPARSLIPPPRKLGEYGRLSESGGSSASLRKSSARIRSGSAGERDSASTLSENSASSLPTPSKSKIYGGSLRRGNSLGRDSNVSSSSSKYRIQF